VGGRARAKFLAVRFCQTAVADPPSEKKISAPDRRYREKKDAAKHHKDGIGRRMGNTPLQKWNKDNLLLKRKKDIKMGQ
jgi:hypothetical protein